MEVIDAGVSPDDLVVFKYQDQGVATLEDGIYVLEDRLKDADFQDQVVRFVRASMKGWKWAEADQMQQQILCLTTTPLVHKQKNIKKNDGRNSKTYSWFKWNA